MVRTLSLFTTILTLSLFTIILLSGLNCADAQEYYYWAYGKKYPLELYSEKQYVLVQGQNKLSITQGLGISDQNISNFRPIVISRTINRSRQNIPARDSLYWSFVNNPIDKSKIKSSDIIYAAPSFLVNGKVVSLSQYFYVKIKREQDLKLLDDLAKQNRVEIVGNDSFMPLWYILSCDKNSKGNALEMANLFYETGHFSSAQPDLMEDLNINCTNDPLFNQQWHLNNTGQSGGTIGNDIRICQAWNITMGCEDIIVAVLDHGLEFNHPDFVNISPISFDTETGTAPSIVRGNHGVAVAGVIGATENNNLGVVGVAPGIQLMSISNSLVATPLSRQNRAAGINFAWQNGADIINNSWGSSVVYQVIDDAIQNATTLGRNSLGTIVVFASGNGNNNSVEYPSNNPQVIAVGAINRTPTRASFSSYGSGLDVVAPGVSISTTDRQGTLGYNQTAGADGDYTSLDGTSFAAPQVAGIAALILSVNPGLTMQQVRNIIESTTDKAGNYSYTLGLGEQPALTWNNQMGYGRVNAFRALQEALPINGPSLVCTRGTFTLQNQPNGTTVTWISSNSSGLSINPTTGVATRMNNFNGRITITASLNGGCAAVNVTRDVWVGRPFDFLVTGPNLVTASSYNNYSAVPWNGQPSFLDQGVNGITWSFPWTQTNSGWDCGGCIGQVVGVTAGTQSTIVSAQAQNTCGTTIRDFEVFVQQVNCPPGGCEEPFFVYPNPSSDELTITTNSTNTDSYSEITLRDSYGTIVYFSRIKSQNQIKFSVKDFRNGIYYLSMTTKGTTIQRQIIIHH
jgi:cell wall-associated protease